MAVTSPALVNGASRRLKLMPLTLTWPAAAAQATTSPPGQQQKL